MKKSNHCSLLNLTFKPDFSSKAIIYMTSHSEELKRCIPYYWTLLVWGLMTSKEKFVTQSCFYSFQVLSNVRSFRISFQFFRHWKKLFQPFLFFFKMSVWLKIRTWSYHFIKRHKSYDRSLDFVLILSYHETMLYVKRLHTD